MKKMVAFIVLAAVGVLLSGFGVVANAIVSLPNAHNEVPVGGIVALAGLCLMLAGLIGTFILAFKKDKE
jgi:hypothetical protein